MESSLTSFYDSWPHWRDENVFPYKHERLHIVQACEVHRIPFPCTSKLIHIFVQYRVGPSEWIGIRLHLGGLLRLGDILRGRQGLQVVA